MAIKRITMFEISFILQLLSIAFGLVLYNRIKPVVLKLLIPLIILGAINEGFSYWGLYKGMKINKLIIYNLYFIFQFIIIGVIHIVILKRYIKLKKLITIFLILLFIVGFFFLNNNLKQLDPNAITMASLSLLVSGIILLFKLNVVEETIFLKTSAIFWFTVGMIIAQTFLILFINALRVDDFRNDINSMMIFKLLNTVGNVFYYLLICLSFFCSWRYRQPEFT